MKAKKDNNPTHYCKALGKNTILPRAYNTAYPDKIFFKCPFCDCQLDEQDNNES